VTQTTGVAPEYGSDYIVGLLHELGVEYVAFNPGATFRGLHDSLVNFQAPRPGVVTCLHEEIAVAIAHGYAKAAGRPMAVALHDVVGLQHAAMAIYNAWCDRVPMLLIGATGPLDAAKRRPWIDWTHTANTQATQVRDYTKWDDQPMSLEAVPESLIRAMQLTRARPSGPVYINIDAMIQEAPAPATFSPPQPTAFATPTPPAPDDAAVAELAQWLVAAARPVIVADYVGRSPEAFRLLLELSELLDIPVLDREGPYNKLSLNFPSQHRLNVASFENEVLAETDLVVGLETRDLFGILNAATENRGTTSRIPVTAKVALVTLAHLVTGAWTGDFQRLQRADLLITGDSESVLAGLLARVRALSEEDRGVAGRRQWTERLAAAVQSRRDAWKRSSAEVAGERPIVWSHLAATLEEVTVGDDRVVANGHLGNWIHRLWDLTEPGQYQGDSGGAGIGYGLGGSVWRWRTGTPAKW
jgi:thiamine pyrophosphate-dependent acetolactate synthase large subunit-like protein